MTTTIGAIVKYNQTEGDACNEISREVFDAKVTKIYEDGKIALNLLWQGEETAHFRVEIPHKNDAEGKKPYWE